MRKQFSVKTSKTPTNISSHVLEIAKKEEAEAASPGEQIQLVAENPDTVISFNVPDGPPPENLVLEGPGTEGMDVERCAQGAAITLGPFLRAP